MASITLTWWWNSELFKSVSEGSQSSKNPYIHIFATASGNSFHLYFWKSHSEAAEHYAGKLFGLPSSTKKRTEFPMIGTDEVGNGSYFGGLAGCGFLRDTWPARLLASKLSVWGFQDSDRAKDSSDCYPRNQRKRSPFHRARSTGLSESDYMLFLDCLHNPGYLSCFKRGPARKSWLMLYKR